MILRLLNRTFVEITRSHPRTFAVTVDQKLKEADLKVRPKPVLYVPVEIRRTLIHIVFP